MPQRKASPWVGRPSCRGAQPSQPLGEYAAKDLKLKRAAVIADDFAFGHENVAGFQRVFEDNGGKVVDRKSTRLNSSHQIISYAVFCLKKKKKNNKRIETTQQHAIRRASS